MTRLLAAMAALTTSALLVTGPLRDWLEDMAWGLDKPGYWSLEQSLLVSLVLLALLYMAFGALVAHWSGIAGWRIAAAVALAAPFTLGFMRLFSLFLHGLVVSGALDVALVVHSPLWAEYLPHVTSSAFHLMTVVIISNLLRPEVATHLTSASS